jgi:hypothetical protein
MKIMRVSSGYRHWCPACEHTHPLPENGWTFNGDPDRPTFTPSFKHGGKRQKIENGRWTGEWHRGADGQPLDGTCHYFITDGKIQFCPDSWHKRSDIVAMPDIPEGIDF